MFKTLFFVGVMVLVFPAVVLAQSAYQEPAHEGHERHGHAQRTAEAHQHGTGYLNIVIDKDKMLIEIIAPGADIVGFEHAPHSDPDRQAVQHAKKQFRNTAVMFQFPAAAGCQANFSDVDFEIGGQKHDHDDGIGAGHGEFHAVYEVHCKKITALEAIKVGYFKLFPAAKQLVARIVGALLQTRSVLTEKAPVIRF